MGWAGERTHVHTRLEDAAHDVLQHHAHRGVRHSREMGKRKVTVEAVWAGEADGGQAKEGPYVMAFAAGKAPVELNCAVFKKPGASRHATLVGHTVRAVTHAACRHLRRPLPPRAHAIGGRRRCAVGLRVYRAWGHTRVKRT